MQHRTRPGKWPSILPTDISVDQCVTRVRLRFGCTLAEAQVAVIGILEPDYSAIGIRLHISASTVRAHYRHLISWTGCQSRNQITALTVATLWSGADQVSHRPGGGEMTPAEPLQRTRIRQYPGPELRVTIR